MYIKHLCIGGFESSSVIPVEDVRKSLVTLPGCGSCVLLVTKMASVRVRVAFSFAEHGFERKENAQQNRRMDWSGIMIYVCIERILGIDARVLSLFSVTPLCWSPVHSFITLPLLICFESSG